MHHPANCFRNSIGHIIKWVNNLGNQDITEFGQIGLPFDYIHIKWLRAIREKLNSFKQIALAALVQFVELVQFVLELLFKPFNMM